MGFVYTLGGIFIIGYILYRFARPDTKVNGFTLPSGPITRDMKDPYSQAMWAAIDTGQVVSYSAGDEKMESYDTKTGKVNEIKFKR